MILPDGEKKLVDFAVDVIDQCRVSCDRRANEARSWRSWYYNGSDGGGTAIYNKIGQHIDRLSSYLFSPWELRYMMEFDHHYPKQVLLQGEMAARAVTRNFSRQDSDVVFGEGVKDALKYGTSIAKMKWDYQGATMRLVNPWQFGVYREDENRLERQEAVNETSYITTHELWRRISHLPGAYDMFRRAKAHAKRDVSPDIDQPYFHQVILAGTSPVIQTGPFSQSPGGMVSVSADPGSAILAPEVADSIIPIHELWVVDDYLGDYTMIQLVEPDILISGKYRRLNPFVPRKLPYRAIQPNMVNGYFWGRSEIADLMKLQLLLRDRLDDVKKIMSLEYDRLLAFIGYEGMTDELYDQFREAGYITMPPGTDVKDVTPKVPDNAFQDIDVIIRFMDDIAGFAPILQGGGEAGVRAGNHAQMLVKTASPRLRDRALLVERQCANVGDSHYTLMAQKDATAYWLEEGADPEKPASEFLLSQLPKDSRITVDSHSSSPIYEDDHLQKLAFLSKVGAIGADSVLDLIDIPQRDMLQQRLKELQAGRAQAAEQEQKVRLMSGRAPKKALMTA